MESKRKANGHANAETEERAAKRRKLAVSGRRLFTSLPMKSATVVWLHYQIMSDSKLMYYRHLTYPRAKLANQQQLMVKYFLNKFGAHRTRGIYRYLELVTHDRTSSVKVR